MTPSTPIASGSRPVPGFQRSRDGDQSTVDGEQVSLGHRSGIGHRHPQQHLALSLGIADRATTGGGLGPADLPAQLGPLVEQADDLPIESVDPPSQPSQLG
jgi:hypothetical protein